MTSFQNFDALTGLAGASAPPLNIAVIGGTGVGKSRLINSFFGEDVAKVGVGRPVTTSIQSYQVPNSNVSIFDTRGLEVEKSAETIRQLEGLIIQTRLSQDIDRHIHIAWLCISAASRRFEPVHEMIAQMLSTANVPFVITVTKSFGPEALDMERHIESIKWIKAPVVRVVSAPKTAGGEIVVDAFGLDQLAGITAQLVGPARAAAANYKIYDAQRRQKTLRALNAIIEKKSFIQSIGTLYAMSDNHSIPVMLALSKPIAKNISDDIFRASEDLQVELPHEVREYIRNFVGEVIFNSAMKKGKSEIHQARATIDEILKGNFSSVKSIIKRSQARRKRNDNPVDMFKDVINLAKGNHVPTNGHQAWEYIREITLVMLAPIVEASLAGRVVIGKPDGYRRSLTGALRWSGTTKYINGDLRNVLLEVISERKS